MPFERFTPERLNEFLTKHLLSPEGKLFLESALAEPSRNAQGTTRNVVSDLPCPKMWGNAQAESWSAENPFTLKHIFDPNVIGYTNQLPPLDLRYKGRNGRTVRAPYRGDCLNLDAQDGPLLEEWKPASDFGVLEEKFPGKYERTAAGEYVSVPISQIVNPWGIKFVVRFSDEIDPIGHRNRRFLYPYLEPRAAEQYANKVPAVLALLGETHSRSHADLTEGGAEPDVLNWAIAHGHLHVDLDSAPIATSPSHVLVFRNEETLQAWKLAIRPDGSHPATTEPLSQLKLRIGDVFVLDGRRLTVTMDGLTTIFALNERSEHVAVDLQVLASALRAGKAILPTCSLPAGAGSRFWSASPSALSRAIHNFEILQAIDRGETPSLEDRYSASTYRRWRRSIREGESKGMSPVEALIDSTDQKGFSGSHIEFGFSSTLNEWIKAGLSDEKFKSPHALYFSIREKAEELGRAMIAKSSFYERVANIRSLQTIRDSQGHKAAYQLEPVYWMLEKCTPVHCERAMELVHFDSTLLDDELRSSISGEILGRPWLSIAVCAYSRRVVGMYLSFQPPSYVSSMMLLADIVRRFGRLPDAIIHDWGSEFKAKDWKYALTSLFIVRHTRPKSAPRFGSVLERMFGIVTRELIDNIAGNTKLRKNVRGLSPQADPSVHSGLWLADLYQGLEEYFFSNYDTRKHPATLRLPRAMFDSSLITHGVRLHRMRRYDDILSVLMPTARGRPRVIDPTRGVYVNYRFYGHPLLSHLGSAGATAMVKPIPFDPGSVLAFLKGNWVVCKTGLHADLQGAPEVVRRCLFEEWRIEQALVRSSHDQSRMKVRELIDRLNQKALENKEYWRDRETHEFTSTAVFSEAVVLPTETKALNRLEEMMQRAVATAMSSRAVGQSVAEAQ